MLMIRFTRIGKRNDPKYRLVVCEKRSARDSKYLEKVGFYDPIPNPHVVTVNKERIHYWLSKGAKLSPSASHIVASLI